MNQSSKGKDEEAKERLARQQANAAVALLRIQPQAEDIWPLLRFSPDPRRRSYLIHRLSELQADPAPLVRRLLQEKETSIRLALLLSRGEYPRRQFSKTDQAQLQNLVERWFVNDPDPGIHGAVSWLLRQWKLPDRLSELEDTLQQHVSEPKTPSGSSPAWYINGEGQTMVVIPGSVSFQMGFPKDEPDRDEDETLQAVEIPRSYAVSAYEVTKEQFQRFYRDVNKREFGHDQMKRYPENDCPIGGVLSFEAGMYCNWLTEQDGLGEDDQCYVIESNRFRLASDYLKRRGYRLPTEAEWKYACRAGTSTGRYYGQSAALLAKYGWYFGTSTERTWPVGSLQPNE